MGKLIDPKTLLGNCNFRVVHQTDDDTLHMLKLGEKEKITVLDRLTGFGFGIRDIETGYKDDNGKFWLVSGNFDIRDYGSITIQEAIEYIKMNANACIGV